MGDSTARHRPDASPYAESNVSLYRQLADAGHGEAELVQARRAYDLVRDLLAGRYRASGRPFVAHAVRTASILLSHGARLEIVLTGLLHFAYGDGDFGDGERGITPARRKELRRVAGDEVEQRVAAYTRLEWDPRRGPVRPFESLEPLERDAILVKLADRLEDHIECDVAYASDAERRVEILQSCAPVMVELAGRLEQPSLARELEGAFSAFLEARPPKSLRAAVDHAYTLPPRSYRVPGLRYRRQLRRALRRLSPRLFGRTTR